MSEFPTAAAAPLRWVLPCKSLAWLVDSRVTVVDIVARHTQRAVHNQQPSCH